MANYRPLVVPSIMTLIGLAILISLGKWQLDRRDWKLGLIERIQARAHGQPVSLSTARRIWEKDRDVEYYRVQLAGRFLHRFERHLYGVVDGKAGWRILTPFETTNGDIVLVDRGIVPDRLKDAASRKAGQIEGTVELIGLARAPEQQGLFTPDNRVEANRWFWRDVARMAASLPSGMAEKALGFMVEAEAQAAPGGWPKGGVTRLTLPNRHLEYAITWFGLAAALFTVFVAYARYRLRQARADDRHATIADKNASV